MMVIYLPVMFEFNWTNRFRVRVQKQKCGRRERRTDGRWTHQSNRRVGYTQPASKFRKNIMKEDPSPILTQGYLPIA